VPTTGASGVSNGIMNYIKFCINNWYKSCIPNIYTKCNKVHNTSPIILFIFVYTYM